jgi:DNA-binding CsgD family transcriptional regulator
VIIDEEAYLMHYGILRKSGRYPWGSGGTQSQRNKMFLDVIEQHKRVDKMTDTQIAQAYGMKTTQYRALKSIARAQQKQEQISEAQRLKNKGMSNIAIGQRMGINESSVRALLAPGVKERADVIETTANALKSDVASRQIVDVGVGVERWVGVSKEKLGTAVARLEEEGYGIHYVKIPQLGTGLNTTYKVLAAPGMTYSQVYALRDEIRPPGSFSDDAGHTFHAPQPPLHINPRRVAVRYANEGGSQADGVIYVRPGVKDVSLGGANYAQVRISVGGTHYLKGMAMYKDDLPDGVDLVFNTNKHPTGNKLDAMKPIKTNKDGSIDLDLPFGSVTRPLLDPRTGKPSSAMNIVNDEGSWEKWSRSLSSQFLSKQSPALAKSQLSMVTDRRAKEFEEIKALTNPAVRRKLLEEFADGSDSSAVKLNAAALPRQSNHVILPINSLKDTEVYAPGFRNGERVVLIRHPHGGVFEIPSLVVNNRNREAKKLLGNATVAIGINHRVAQHLSGADFDGDTVIVIPNDRGHIKTAPPLAELKNFDPQRDYPGYEGMKKMTSRDKAFEMGLVSNLITDMTIRGASNAELARAVRHSMVVIDAEKHGLNYRQSAVDNGIGLLMQKYQGKTQGGASTLISRASSEKRVPERKQGFKVNPRTGEKMFTETGNTFVNARGKVEVKTQKSTKLAEVRDAHTLSSGTPIEKIYADHANQLKSLANQARLAAHSTKGTPYSPSAKAAYRTEVTSLDHKLNVALKNAPLERRAQAVGNAIYKQKLNANPDMEPSERKKVKAKALEDARARTGARKIRIDITASEWAAIQAGAISNDKLNKILNNADMDVVRQLATPKATTLMTGAKQRRAQSMLASGYTQAEVADALGVSLTTLKTSLKEGS